MMKPLLLLLVAALQQDGERPGRYVRIELPGASRVLSLAEVEVVRDGRNLAGSGQAKQINTAHEGAAARAIDGYPDGVYNDGSVTHTAEGTDPWWELDLGSEQPIDQITVWNRTDCCSERLEGFRLVVLNDAREVVWSVADQPAPSPRRDFSLWGSEIVRPPPPTIDKSKLQPGINAAIDRGVDYLMDVQLRDGSWEAHSEGYRAGQTALSVYTLLKSGVPRTHPAVVRGIAYLEGQTSQKTYVVGCTLMAVGALADEDRYGWMSDLADELTSWQDGSGATGIRTGLWGYPDRVADLSNTQYAVLGLHAARKAGIDVPRKVWMKTLEGTLECQEQPQVTDTNETIAGFVYSDAGTGPYGRPTGSMTTAGVAVLAICESALGDNIPVRLQKQVEAAKRYGLAWLAYNFSVTSNPGHDSNEGYYLYGLERVGALLDIDRIGEHDWYWEGARHLVKKQGGDGKWENETDTCFALLFLSKATASSTGPSSHSSEPLYASERVGVDVRWRGTGENPITLWISGFGDAAVQGGEVHVERVDYLCDGVVVKTVDADPGVAWKGERFAVRHAFPRRGEYVLQANVVVRTGDGTNELRSEPFRVRVRNVLEDWMEPYARQGVENLLRAVNVRVTASSQLGGQTPQKAIDGLHGTAWIAGKDDTTPTLTLELGKALRVKTLALSHVHKYEKDRGTFDRPTRVHLYVNRTKSPLVVDLSEDVERKTFFTFPKTTSVRRLSIQIMERVSGTTRAGEVGFSEVELFDE